VFFLSSSRQMPEWCLDYVEFYLLRPLLATCFQAGFLLGLFFDHEDGVEIFLRKFSDFLRNIRRYILEHKTLHNHCCENLRSYLVPTRVRGSPSKPSTPYNQGMENVVYCTLLNRMGGGAFARPRWHCYLCLLVRCV
jgi:hypothetical protein